MWGEQGSRELEGCGCRYLEDDDEGQSGSQDTPVLFGEVVGVWRPRGLPVVLVPGRGRQQEHTLQTHARQVQQTPSTRLRVEAVPGQGYLGGIVHI